MRYAENFALSRMSNKLLFVIPILFSIGIGFF